VLSPKASLSAESNNPLRSNIYKNSTASFFLLPFSCGKRPQTPPQQNKLNSPIFTPRPLDKQEVISRMK
jgi:hypothetical protein